MKRIFSAFMLVMICFALSLIPHGSAISGHSSPPSTSAEASAAASAVALQFDSEDEFIKYMAEEQREYDINQYQLASVRCYYKFAKASEDLRINRVSLGTHGMNVAVLYDTGYFENDDKDYPEYMMLQYSPHYSYDLKYQGLWTSTPHGMIDKFITEKDGRTYYIQYVHINYYDKEATPVYLWGIEFKHDGFIFDSELPGRYSLDEALELVSNVERIDIENPMAGKTLGKN